MRIAFLLPGPSRRPSGGYLVVFRYADALRQRGHQVDLLVPRLRADRRRWRWPAQLLWPALRLLPNRGRWAPEGDPPGVREIPVLTRASLRGCDVVVATGWDTAEDLGRLRPDGHGCAYLIQGFEDWAGTRERVEATWRLPFRRVVIAQWLVDRAAELGALPVDHVPNAIDTAVFRCLEPPSQRSSALVGLLLHPDPVKGSDIALRALATARSEVPQLTALAFSAYDDPIADLPPWVELTVRPTQRELVGLYNQVSVFLSASRSEGWALPPAEAMACGAALVSTDIGGVRDYARDTQTARLAPSEDPDALAAALVQLLRDPPARVALAERGTAVIHSEFSWAASTDLLETSLAAARTASP